MYIYTCIYIYIHIYICIHVYICVCTQMGIQASPIQISRSSLGGALNSSFARAPKTPFGGAGTPVRALVSFAESPMSVESTHAQSDAMSSRGYVANTPSAWQVRGTYTLQHALQHALQHREARDLSVWQVCGTYRQTRTHTHTHIHTRTHTHASVNSS